MDFSNVNLLAVLVSGAAAFALGALWYSPVLFSKAWQKEVGLSDEDLQSGNMAVTFGTSLLMMLVMALGLAVLFEGTITNWQSGAVTGLLVGLFFVATSMAINLAYQRKSVRLWLIDGVYQVLFLAIIGAILGAWQ